MGFHVYSGRVHFSCDEYCRRGDVFEAPSGNLMRTVDVKSFLKEQIGNLLAAHRCNQGPTALRVLQTGSHVETKHGKSVWGIFQSVHFLPLHTW